MEPRVIGELHWPKPWFKFGWFFDHEMQYNILGFGLVSFEIHWLTWHKGFDIDWYINSPIGHIGLNFTHRSEEA